MSRRGYGGAGRGRVAAGGGPARQTGGWRLAVAGPQWGLGRTACVTGEEKEGGGGGCNSIFRWPNGPNSPRATAESVNFRRLFAIKVAAFENLARVRPRPVMSSSGWTGLGGRGARLGPDPGQQHA